MIWLLGFYNIAQFASAPPDSESTIAWALGVIATALATWITKIKLSENKYIAIKKKIELHETEFKEIKAIIIELNKCWGPRGNLSDIVNKRLQESKYLYKEYTCSKKRELENVNDLLKQLYDMHNVKDSNGIYLWWVTSTIIRDLTVSHDRLTDLVKNLIEVINKLKKE